MSKPFKVAHFAYGLSIGGVTNILKQLVNGQSDEVEQIVILLSEAEEPNADFSHIKIYSLNQSLAEEYTLKGFFKIWLNPGKYHNNVVAAIAKIYEEEKFDIFHFHGIPKDLPIGKLLKKGIPAIKLVYTDHMLRITTEENESIKGKMLAMLYKQFYKPYHTIFVSKTSYTTARSIGFIKEGNQHTFIENSINTSCIVQKKDYTIPRKARIVYLSRITAVKGHFLLIDVVKKILQKDESANFEFVLIGPGELTEKLKAAIKENSLTDYFTFLGPRNDISELLYTYDLAVFPSESEGLPIALLEKMAAGLPVAASGIPGIKNVIQKQDEALLFPVNDAEACASIILQLMGDQKLRKDTGEAARKAVVERYSGSLLDKYIEFYRQIRSN